MTTPGKLVWIVGIVAFTTVVSGFFMGLLQTSRQAADSIERSTTWHEVPATTNADQDVPTAPRYLDLRERRAQPNRDWQSRTDELPRVGVADGTELVLSAVEQVAQRHARAERRAFDGAPPIVPHPIDQSASFACLACHGEPVRVDQKLVPQISHPAYTQCLQCHAAGTGPRVALAEPVGVFDASRVTTVFDGHQLEHGGTRSFEGAPAVIPHTTWMRENCMSCHGPGGSSALRTSHPSRQSCVQCHPANAALDARPLISLAQP